MLLKNKFEKKNGEISFILDINSYLSTHQDKESAQMGSHMPSLLMIGREPLIGLEVYGFDKSAFDFENSGHTHKDGIVHLK